MRDVVDAPRGREGRRSRGVIVTSREEDLLRRRRPQDADPGHPRGRRRGVRRGRRRMKASCAARDARQAGRRRDQRRGARRRPRDRAGLPPPRSSSTTRRSQLGLPEVDPRPAAGRRRHRPHRPDARPARRADGRAAPGPAAASPRRPRRSASSTSSSPTATSWCRAKARGSWIRANPEAAKQPWDRHGLQDARRHAVAARRSRRSCPRSRPTCASSSRAPTTRRRKTILAAAVEGAQVDFDTAAGSRAATSSSWSTGQISKNMIQAFFFDLQAINSRRRASGRPTEVRSRPGSACSAPA